MATIEPIPIPSRRPVSPSDSGHSRRESMASSANSYRTAPLASSSGSSVYTVEPSLSSSPRTRNDTIVGNGNTVHAEHVSESYKSATDGLHTVLDKSAREQELAENPPVTESQENPSSVDDQAVNGLLNAGVETIPDHQPADALSVETESVVTTPATYATTVSVEAPTIPTKFNEDQDFPGSPSTVKAPATLHESPVSTESFVPVLNPVLSGTSYVRRHSVDDVVPKPPTMTVKPVKGPSVYLPPPPSMAVRPTRRNTTGSHVPPINLHSRGHSQPTLYTDRQDNELASDIEKYAEEIRQERIQKRAKMQKEAEEDMARKSEVPLVGNLIGVGHVNYVLMWDMLSGIRVAVSRCQAKISRPLTVKDFTEKHKYSFDIVGNELTPSAQYEFRFKDYAPWVFRELREKYFGLDPADYLVSLTDRYILSELGSPGKSGSFFYFSRDFRFIIKAGSGLLSCPHEHAITIHPSHRHAEHKFLLSILPKYYDHIKTNPHTLLSRFYGLHRVKLPRGRKIHFLIMNNLFPPHKDIHETYDLKGSTVGREYPEEKAALKSGAVLKDLNWINRKRTLELGPEKRTLFAVQVERDAALLKACKAMDYSLLIGIHNVKRGNKDNVRSNTLKVWEPRVAPPRRATTYGFKGRKTAEAIAVTRAMHASDPTHLGTALPADSENVNDGRERYIFYQDHGGFAATDEEDQPLDTIYYFGVIDILTRYTLVKRAEHFWKGLKADRHKISPVNPAEYGDRFIGFLKDVVRGGGGGQSFK